VQTAIRCLFVLSMLNYALTDSAITRSLVRIAQSVAMQFTLPKVCLLLIGIIAGMAIMIAMQRTAQQSEGNKAVAQQTETSAEQSKTVSQPFGTEVPSSGAAQALGTQTAAPQPPPDAALPRMPGAVSGRMMEYEQTTSGYPIAIGRRAVDSDANGSTAYGGTSEKNIENATNNAPVALDENGTVVTPEPRQIGRNGMISNPCMDPASVKGKAYSHAY